MSLIFICFASPSCGDQSITGRKVVLIGFFVNFHCRFLIKSPCRAPPPTLKPKNCDGWLLHAPDTPTNKISNKNKVATHWPPSFLSAWLDHHRFPTWAQKPQKSSAALPPPLHACSPRPPGVLRVV